MAKEDTIANKTPSLVQLSKVIFTKVCSPASLVGHTKDFSRITYHMVLGSSLQLIRNILLRENGKMG